MTHSEKSRKLFCSGFNCTQAVLTAFAPDFGLDEDTALRIATHFGGGARAGELCGAVSGALLVLGLDCGYSDSSDTEAIKDGCSKSTEFNRRFTERCGNLVCRELLGCDIGIPEKKKEARERGLFAEKCPQFIQAAVEILEEML